MADVIKFCLKRHFSPLLSFDAPIRAIESSLPASLSFTSGPNTCALKAVNPSALTSRLPHKTTTRLFGTGKL